MTVRTIALTSNSALVKEIYIPAPELIEQSLPRIVIALFYLLGKSIITESSGPISLTKNLVNHYELCPTYLPKRMPRPIGVLLTNIIVLPNLQYLFYDMG